MMGQYPLRTVHKNLGNYGVQPGTVDLTCVARGGAHLAGDVLMQDFLGTQTLLDGLTALVGESSLGFGASTWGAVTAPVTAGLAITAGTAQPFFCVAQRAVADLGDVSVRLYGMTQAFTIASAGTTAFGIAWVPSSAKNANVAPVMTSNSRSMGMIQHAGTTPTTRALGELFINGLGGLGLGVFFAAA